MPSLTTKVELLFGGRCKRPPQGVHFAPGRLVVLGEHLDHQLGRVLATPLREGVACAWGVRPDSRVVVWSMNARQKDSFHQDRLFKSGRSWADLARGAYAHVAADGRRMPGIDLMVLGDLQIGQGLASSAAYLVVLLRSIYDAVGVYRSRFELAQDVPAIEEEWLGVRCGSMDPYVVASAKSAQVLHVDCRELDHETLQLPEGHAFVGVESGIQRRLPDTPYNARRAELESALAAIQREQPDLRGLCDLGVDALPALATQLDETPLRRVRHVVTETARVRAAAAAVESGDMQALGSLMNDGHRSLVEDFESSFPEIDRLAEEVRQRPEVLGARLNGAGWGGQLAVLTTVDPD